MKKSRAIMLVGLVLAVLGIGLTVAYIDKPEEKVIDLSKDGVAGIEACPVHDLAFSSERVSAWHGRFSPRATKEWWQRAAEAREKFPYAVPFPAQVEESDIDVVVRSYCPECRERFNAFVEN